ncbi:hypothetical protein COLO4_24954 [Corchorus olitorius]|uniref:Uncharacterized protein n=1 Tax=Corchorus olitorius TaxID=93759 RepID=A0A1R3I5R8_9ROSI|nr:hypothetical protein COLO4_24954 [Corchorus olitorius]
MGDPRGITSKHTNTASTKTDTTLQEGKQQPATSRPARTLGDC